MSVELDFARSVFATEIEAVGELHKNLGPSFEMAIGILKKTQGKVITSGLGKSGIIAQKLSATLSSTGTPSFYLHPTEGAHGDFGAAQPEDVFIVISYSGESSELLALVDYSKQNKIPLIALTSNSKSFLGDRARVVLDISVSQEAGPLGLAPSSSTTASLVLCDALALTLMKIKNIDSMGFAQAHPKGSLGKKLLTQVQDVMVRQWPRVTPEASLLELVEVMSSGEVRGFVCVFDNSNLSGVITDGDLRRALQKTKENEDSIFKLQAQDIMSSNSKYILENAKAELAFSQMNKFRIQCLVVKNKDLEVVGLLHIQDLINYRL